MTLVRGGFCLLLAGCECLAANQRDPDLKALYEARQWFQLRQAVEATRAPAFYRVVVACAFNDVTRAEKHFKQVLKAAPHSSEAFDCHGMLAYALARAGHYRQAVSHLEAMQAARPDSAGLKSALTLFAALSRYPDPSVARRRASEIPLSKDMFLPVSVNGTAANYGFDSGMDLSVMSEAEARRLNLTVREVPGSEFQDGASGNRVGVRFAIAERLDVGGFQLRHVSFLVVRNDAMPFVELPPDKQGILGLPVLLAFRTVRWTADGMFQIGFLPARGTVRRSSLCFAGISTPVVEGLFGQARIRVVLDTGSGKTLLTPLFARDFPETVSQTGRKESEQLRGLGGTTESEVISLPEIRFQTGGFDLVLRPAKVLQKDTRVDRESYHVWLGMDLLGQARRVTLDFHSMTFALE